LIVDDDPVIRDILSSMVQSVSDFTTEVAVDGVEGLEKLEDGGFDIVFTDIKMPRMGGLEFIRALRNQHPEIPIVVISAYAYLETAVSAMREGAFDFITKPFKLHEIKFIIHRLQNELDILQKIGGKNGNRELVRSLHTEIYDKLKEISLMHTVFSELDEITDNRELFERCVSLAVKLLKVKEASFGILEQNSLNIIHAAGTTEKRVELKPKIVEMLKRDRKPLVMDVGQLNPVTLTPLVAQMLMLPLILKDEVFGVLTLGRKSDGYNFNDEEIELARTFSKKLSLKIENNALYDIFYNNLLNTLKSLVLTIEARDSYTKHHSERVTKISVEIAEMINCPSEEIDAIKFGGYLHDIGKIGVRDTVLLKPSRLTDEEFREIRMHPVIGDNIIKPLGSFPNERLIVRHHHERFDGTGYPDGLGGEDIPRVARILSIADTYDSMTTTRPYRKALSHETAIEEIRRCAGTQFDPSLVEAFLETRTGRGESSDEQ